MDLINWIRNNSPISFDMSTGHLRAFTLIGGQAAEVPIPQEFVMKEDDPAVQYARKIMERGPLPSQKFTDHMKKAGFSRKQITSAKNYLGLISSPQGFRSKWLLFYKDK